MSDDPRKLIKKRNVANQLLYREMFGKANIAIEPPMSEVIPPQNQPPPPRKPPRRRPDDENDNNRPRSINPLNRTLFNNLTISTSTNPINHNPAPTY